MDCEHANVLSSLPWVNVACRWKKLGVCNVEKQLGGLATILPRESPVLGTLRGSMAD